MAIYFSFTTKVLQGVAIMIVMHTFPLTVIKIVFKYRVCFTQKYCVSGTGRSDYVCITSGHVVIYQ